MATHLNPTAQALAETILYTECDDDGTPLDRNYGIADFDEKSLEMLYNQFQQFIQVVETKITEKIGDNWSSVDDFYDLMQPSENQTEYDYILTRNHHGAGFWDGDWSDSVSQILTDAAHDQSEICTYVGDDEKNLFRLNAMPQKKDLDQYGIPCPLCGEKNRKVIESRPMQSYVYRRCICENCNNRFTTYEARSDYEGFIGVRVNSKLLEKIDELEKSLEVIRKIIEEPLEKIHSSLL